LANKHNNRIVALYDEGNRFVRRITVERARRYVKDGHVEITRRGLRFRRNSPRAGDEASRTTALAVWDRLVSQGHDPRDKTGEVNNPTQAVYAMQRIAPYRWGEHK
jgi:hypothetical protein